MADRYQLWRPSRLRRITNPLILTVAFVLAAIGSVIALPGNLLVALARWLRDDPDTPRRPRRLTAR